MSYTDLEITDQLTLDNAARVKAPNGQYVYINAVNGQDDLSNPIAIFNPGNLAQFKMYSPNGHYANFNAINGLDNVNNSIAILTLGTASLRMSATDGSYIDIGCMTDQGMGAPILQISKSLMTKNDIIVYGSINTMSDPSKGAGGGALLIGYGWLGSAHQDHSIIAQSPPLIELENSSTPVYHGSGLPNASDMYYGVDQGGQIYYNETDHNLYVWSGRDGTPAYQWLFSEANPAGNNNIPNYDTLFLVKVDGCTPAHLDLGNLTVHGDLIVYGAFWNDNIIEALFNTPSYATGFTESFLSNIPSESTIHYI